MSHKYHNQYFSVMGDSISTLSGYSQPEDAVFYRGMNKLEADVFAPADTWWGQVIELLGAQLLVNDSFSGSMVTKRPDCVYPSYGCSDERTSALHNRHATPDVIMVYLGTNDWGCGAQPLPKAAEQANDLTVFSVAYTEMLKKLRANYPDAEIWCFTLAVSTYSAHPDFAFPYRYRKRHIAEYCEVIRDCARSQGCRLIDLYEGAEPYDTVDGFHPNRQGMQTLSAAVISELAKGDAI